MVRGTLAGVIYDLLSRAAAYRSLSSAFARAFEHLLSVDHAAIPDGKLAVDGDHVFAIYQSYVPKPIANGRWESHKRYADIQVMLTGQERMGFLDLDRVPYEAPFDASKDLGFHLGALSLGQSIVVRPAEFAVFFPHDAHMPSLAIDDAPASTVRKVVMKVKV
jgi:biofilm protein TabA